MPILLICFLIVVILPISSAMKLSIEGPSLSARLLRIVVQPARPPTSTAGSSTNLSPISASMKAVSAAAEPGTQDRRSLNVRVDASKKASLTGIGSTCASGRGAGGDGGVVFFGTDVYRPDASRCMPFAESARPYARWTALMYGVPISLAHAVAATLSESDPVSHRRSENGNSGRRSHARS